MTTTHTPPPNVYVTFSSTRPSLSVQGRPLKYIRRETVDFLLFNSSIHRLRQINIILQVKRVKIQPIPSEINSDVLIFCKQYVTI